MKVRFLIAVIFIISLPAVAQQDNKNSMALGIIGGINFQTITGKNTTGTKLDSKIVPGFHIGLHASIPFLSNLELQPAVLFSTKGTILKEQSAETRVNLKYVEIPVNLVCKLSAGQGNILVGVGPYVAFGLDGYVKNGGIKSNIFFNTENDVTIAGIRQYKRLDAGINSMLGYAVKKISFRLNSQLGLVNIKGKSSAPDIKRNYKNTGFGLSVAYVISKNNQGKRKR